MKKTLAILSFVSVIGLTACSHENPLKIQPKDKSIEFLKEASIYASNKMGYHSLFIGNTYAWCMNDEINEGPGFCEKLYENMVDYAKQKNSVFSNITTSDLKDKQYFSSVEEDYFHEYNEIRKRSGLSIYKKKAQ